MGDDYYGPRLFIPCDPREHARPTQLIGVDLTEVKEIYRDREDDDGDE